MAMKPLAEILCGETRFGRLTIMREANPKWQRGKIVRQVECQCDCGSQKIAILREIRRGGVKSCGCLSLERNLRVSHLGAKASRKHGLAKTPAHNSWTHMRQRCLNEKADNYDRYGGRGISIHPSWVDDFSQFHADMGDRPTGTSIDRIDPDGDYEPGNCRWATPKEQQNNRRCSR